MSWGTEIARAREQAENESGEVVDFIVVRPEIWAMLQDESALVNEMELDGVAVAVCDLITEPFTFVVRLHGQAE